MRKIEIKFNGYYPEKDLNLIPDIAGLYIVYKGQSLGNNTVKLSDLIYIGQSVHINTRIQQHIAENDFKSTPQEELFFSWAQRDSMNDRDMIEKALIFTQKPAANKNLKDNCDIPTSEFFITGKCKLLNNTHFIIRNSHFYSAQ